MNTLKSVILTILLLAPLPAIIPAVTAETNSALTAKNGEAIYGTTASPIPFLSWGRCTRRGDSLYFHVFEWPANRDLRIPMQAKVTAAHLLAKPNEPLKCEQRDGAVIVRVPKEPTDAAASVIKVTIAGEPVVEPPPQRNKPIRSSHGNPAAAFDGDPGRSWEEQKGKREGWIEVDLLHPTPIHAMAFDEPHRGAGKRGQKYRLQMRVSDAWKEVVAGETEGYAATRIFPTVTGRVFRLEIYESKDTAAISELQLYQPE